MANYDNPNGFRPGQANCRRTRVTVGATAVAEFDVLGLTAGGLAELYSAGSHPAGPFGVAAEDGAASAEIEVYVIAPDVLFLAQFNGTHAAADNGDRFDLTGATGAMQIGAAAATGVVQVLRWAPEPGAMEDGANARVECRFVVNAAVPQTADVVTEAAVLAALSDSATAKDMGGGAVTNVGLVDGVDVSGHAARHAGGGADAIANAVAAGAAGLMTGADKTKLDGITAGATPCNEANVLAALVATAAAKDMGGGAVTNVGLVDGVDVSGHAARHAGGGADAIANAVAAGAAGLMTGTDKSKLDAFTRTSDVPAVTTDRVTATAAETAFAATQPTTPLGTPAVGDRYQFGGTVRVNGDNGADTMATRLKYGGATLCTVPASDIEPDDIVRFEGEFEVVEAGASGNIQGGGTVTTTLNGTSGAAPFVILQEAVTPDFTANPALSVTVEFSSNNAGNQADLVDLYLRRIPAGA